MRKVILNLAVTLDGFIEGPNGEVDWCRTGNDEGGESFFDRFLAGIDTIFYGRTSYDAWGKYQPLPGASAAEIKLWQQVHSKRKYVFSRSAVEEQGATFIGDDFAGRVRQIREQPGKDIWLYGGSSLITGFINEGLVDSFLLAVFPVILGAGKPLFSGIRNRVGLNFNGVESSASGVILLSYDLKR